jgi:hypothetical protein
MTMQLRFAAALLTLALPVLAQNQSNPANTNATEAENVFYKAFWLEKGEHNRLEAMALYEKFLSMAPDHPKAKIAAQNQFALLNLAGQTKEAEAFAQKYGKLLGGNAQVTPGDAGAAPRGEGAGAGGGRRGAGGGAPQGQPGVRQPATPEQIKELEAKLAKAKEEGNTEEAAQLERQLQRAKAPADGQGRRGQGGQGQGRGRGVFGPDTKKFADMTPEEMTQFQQGLDRVSNQIDRLRENGMEERAKTLEEGVAAIKKALNDKKLDDAQKAFDKLRESMGRRGGGGGK